MIKGLYFGSTSFLLCPNFEKVEGHIALGSSVRASVHASVTSLR